MSAAHLADEIQAHAAGAVAAQRAVDRVRCGEDCRDVAIALPAELSRAWVAAALRELLKAVR